MALIEWAVRLVGAYLGLGFVFALFFASIGVRRVDPSAAGASFGFRLLIIPGVTALWPFFALRLASRRNHPPLERNAHRRAAEAEGR